MRMLSPRPYAAQRADIYDPAAARLLHQSRSALATKEDRFQIHRVDEVPILLGDIHWIEPGEPRRIIHEAVQAAEPLLHVVKHPRDFVYALQIGAEQFRP